MNKIFVAGAVGGHVHGFPVKFTETIRANFEWVGIPQAHNAKLPVDFTPASYLAQARQYGIEYAIHLPLAKQDASARTIGSINDAAAQFQSDSDGKVFSFGTVNPYHEEGVVRAEIMRIRELGLRGLKFHPLEIPPIENYPLPQMFQNFDPGKEQYDYIYRLAADYGLMICWHMGQTFEGKLNQATPKIIAEIAKRYKTIKMIAEHMGGDKWESVRNWLADRENVFFGLSYTYPNTLVSAALAEYFPNNTPTHVRAKMSPESIQRAIADVGLGRIFYGDDFPYMDIDYAMAGLEMLGLSDLQLQAILKDNPYRIFDIDP